MEIGDAVLVLDNHDWPSTPRIVRFFRPIRRVSMVAGLTIDARVEIDVVAGMRKTTRR
jgi:enamine deaminase RidA (YjgF/YER057c/UK114 family)